VALPGTDPEVVEIGRVNRAHTLFEFSQVEATASQPGPNYVFAHFLVPHPPYVFNADGSQPTAEQTAERGTYGGYIEQMRWTNTRILQLLDTLLAGPVAERPVIVVAADEGPYPPRYEANQRTFPWLEATPAEVSQKFEILNAMYLPGLDPAAYGYNDRRSPVNTFRIVFNAEFDAGLPLLPDVSYLSPDQGHLYQFTAYDRPN
jgi:phosphoglycerol transferase MdoB-like AlkP superfamily enzyme